MADDTPYQHLSQIEQLRAEKANAEAYGQADRAAAADKTLQSLGYREAAKTRKQAAEQKAEEEATEGGDKTTADVRTQPPQGRTTKQEARGTRS